MQSEVLAALHSEPWKSPAAFAAQDSLECVGRSKVYRRRTREESRVASGSHAIDLQQDLSSYGSPKGPKAQSSILDLSCKWPKNPSSFLFDLHAYQKLLEASSWNTAWGLQFGHSIFCRAPLRCQEVGEPAHGHGSPLRGCGAHSGLGALDHVSEGAPFVEPLVRFTQ